MFFLFFSFFLNFYINVLASELIKSTEIAEIKFCTKNYTELSHTAKFVLKDYKFIKYSILSGDFNQSVKVKTNLNLPALSQLLLLKNLATFHISSSLHKGQYLVYISKPWSKFAFIKKLYKQGVLPDEIVTFFVKKGCFKDFRENMNQNFAY